MRRAPARALVAALLLLGGCSLSSDDEPGTTAAAPPPPPAAAADEPRGRLSADEYAALRTAVDRAERADEIGDPNRAAPALARACRAVESPRTGLVQAVRRECNRAVELVREWGKVERLGPRCRRAAAQGDTACLTGSFTAMGRAAHRLAAASQRTRVELGRRGIRGACARALGTSRGEIRELIAFERSLRSARVAADAGDAPAFQRALARILAVGDEIAQTDTSGLVRRCRRE
jgi:hypothetical protein